MKDRKNNNFKSNSFKNSTSNKNNERNSSVNSTSNMNNERSSSVNSYSSSVNGTNLGNDRRIGSVTNTTGNSYRDSTSNNAANSYTNSMNNTENSTNCISGVKCEVSKCYYHKSNNMCGAPSINIQCKSASTVEETDCSTFRLK